MMKIRHIFTLAIALTVAVIGWAQAPERPQPGKFAIKKVDFDHVKSVIENPNNAY